jgi:hypothetical protein
MKHSSLLHLGCAFALCLGTAVPSVAAPKLTGVDKIHDQRRVGGKICFIDHAHRGEANMPSKRGAQAAAQRAWEVFTRDEYGTAWGRYSLAINKRMECKASGSRWTCETTAIPCRPR